MTAMVKLYLDKIQSSRMSVHEVPPRWQEQVRKELEKLNKENEE